jgi:hypothetical protein
MLVRMLAAALLLAPPPPAAPAAGSACRESRLPGGERSSEDGVSRLRQELDVDGDGRLDTLEVEDSSGSSSGLRSVTLVMGDGERLQVDYEYNFSAITQTVDIPMELRDAGHERAREQIEDALFGTVCPGPDPSLERLLGSGAPLRWISGPPVLPGTYALRRDDEWLNYLGHNHAYRMGRGPVEPVVLARRGRKVLLGTPHAVILTDPERAQHAWLYVSRPEHMLRFPSVIAARFHGTDAAITLSRGDGFRPDPGTRLVRVDLRTGRVR